MEKLKAILTADFICREYNILGWKVQGLSAKKDVNGRWNGVSNNLLFFCATFLKLLS